jgi:hypothetical protein
MIALVPLLLLGGVLLVEQPIDGVQTDLTQWRIRTETYTRCADLDGDGPNDIITPTAAAFQRNGQFPKAQQTPLPHFDGLAYMDVWDNEIYVLMRDRIEVLRWSKSEWQRTLSQPIDWGDAVRRACFGSDPPAKSSAPLFEHFLCNVDGSRSPEIVRVAVDGIHVFSKKDLFYAEAAVWQIVPPLRAYVPRGTLWPSAARRIKVPQLMSRATVRVEKTGVSVQTQIPAGIARTFYRQDSYAFDAARGLSLSPAPDRSIESEVVDRGYECTELNRDDVMDLIRVDITGETAAPLAMPIVETSVSTDGGKTFFTAKSLGAKPLRAVTDFNQDGRLDLVSENKRLVEGGICETLVRGLTRREVDLEVAVRLQDESGGFPAKPTFSQTFAIALDKPPAYQSAMFMSFLYGGLFSLDGDFDGDGIRDAVIHDRPDRITIRRGAPSGISSEVLATLPASAQRQFAIVDIDGDGRSDLLLSGGSGTDKADGEKAVYLSRESAP